MDEEKVKRCSKMTTKLLLIVKAITRILTKPKKN